VVKPVLSAGTRFVPATGPDRILCHPRAADTDALIRLGADIHRLRAALAAEGIASALEPGDGAPAILALSQPPL
jgi:coenzyme F420-0:L-glutamate ligase/coenzyme F420-1:gamma-L-glutamate ligase